MKYLKPLLGSLFDSILTFSHLKNEHNKIDKKFTFTVKTMSTNLWKLE